MDAANFMISIGKTPGVLGLNWLLGLNAPKGGKNAEKVEYNPILNYQGAHVFQFRQIDSCGKQPWPGAF